jgi:HK97 family phage major capsid protein
MVRVSRELLADSINVEAALEDALARSLALEVDRVCLFGTGVDPQPKGITLASGIQSLSVGGANGGQLANYAPILQGLQKLSEANADAATAIIMAPRTKFGLAGLLDTTNQPLNVPAIVTKVPQLDTTAVPVNMAKGTATNATKIILGDFSQMMFGVRQELELEIDRSRYIDTLEVAFIAHLRFDVQFAHNEAFCVIDGIIP